MHNKHPLKATPTNNKLDSKPQANQLQPTITSASKQPSITAIPNSQPSKQQNTKEITIPHLISNQNKKITHKQKQNI